MTQNQIAYAKLLEDQRSHRQNEALKQQEINIALAEIPIHQQQVYASTKQADIAEVNSQTKQAELEWEKERWNQEYGKRVSFKLLDGVIAVGSPLIRAWLGY